MIYFFIFYMFPHHVCVGLLDFYFSPVLPSSLLLLSSSASLPLQSPAAIYRQLPPSPWPLRAATSIAYFCSPSCPTTKYMTLVLKFFCCNKMIITRRPRHFRPWFLAEIAQFFELYLYIVSKRDLKRSLKKSDFSYYVWNLWIFVLSLKFIDHVLYYILYIIFFVLYYII